MPAPRRAVVLLLAAALAACGGGRAAPRTPPPTATAAPVPVATTPQALYESGRYADVLVAVGPGAGPADQWFAASAAVRLDRPAEIADRLGRLAANGDPAWQVVAGLMRARIASDRADLAAALEATLPFPAHAAVQFERGRGHLARGEYSEAAAAFERAADAEPRLAYAYYYAALAYQELGRRADMAVRFETFMRLAPNAPERPEVRSVLSTVGR